MVSPRNNTTTQTAAEAAARALDSRNELYAAIDDAVETAHAELEAQRAANDTGDNELRTDAPTNS